MTDPGHNAPHVVVVDDEADLCELLSLRLEHHGYRVTTRQSGRDALHVLDHQQVDAMLLDLLLDGENGLEVLAEAHKRVRDVPVLILTAHGSIGHAVEATRIGAYDFVTKPFDDRDLLQRLSAAVEHARTRRAAASLRRGSGERSEVRLVGSSPQIREVRTTIARVARSEATVLVLGESGTGKEVAARTLHVHSGRTGRFVAVNCGALPADLLESELFGHLRGSFTGAMRDKEGLFAAADGGTLFLDEIGDAPLSVQVKLLRVLQERSYLPVGGLDPRNVDVRIVAATNRDLRADIDAGRFREDLFYRLDVVPITMPPLRERREDIPLLAELFVARAVTQHGLELARISPGALQVLAEHDWPGNVRELGNVIEAAALLCDDGILTSQHLWSVLSARMAASPSALARAERTPLPAPLPSTAPSTELTTLLAVDRPVPPMREARSVFDRAYLIHVLSRAAGNVTAAARMAGRNRTDFYDLLRRYELNPLHFRATAGGDRAR
ncbi:MAG: sigma-54 dependent transcriptional regulator [Polyangiales bacterium]